MIASTMVVLKIFVPGFDVANFDDEGLSRITGYAVCEKW